MDTFLDACRGLFGIAVFVGVAALFSSDRKNIPWRVVTVGILLQFLLAAMVIHLPPVRMAVEAVGLFFVKLLGFSVRRWHDLDGRRCWGRVSRAS
jgi:CNT family concentrative nucleoside transporter